MKYPWLPILAVCLLASFVQAASTPPAEISKFFSDYKIVTQPEDEVRLFETLLKGEAEAAKALGFRPDLMPVQFRFGKLVADAQALEARYASEEGPGFEPKPEQLANITAEDTARLTGVVKNAEAAAAGWMNSVRFQVGAGPSEDGYTNFGGGAMVRFGYGSERAGSIGVQGGVIGATNGSSSKLLHREMVDHNYPWERPFEVWEETRRNVDGLRKARIGGVNYVSPAIGGRVQLEAGIDIGYASLNTAPETVRETYISEFVRLSSCYDGICEDWRTRTLSRELLHQGSGIQDSAWGNTIYGAANVKVRRDSPWAVRVEVAKDRYKAFPEASGMTYSAGGVYNFGK